MTTPVQMGQACATFLVWTIQRSSIKKSVALIDIVYLERAAIMTPSMMVNDIFTKHISHPDTSNDG